MSVEEKIKKVTLENIQESISTFKKDSDALFLRIAQRLNDLEDRISPVRSKEKSKKLHFMTNGRSMLSEHDEEEKSDDCTSTDAYGFSSPEVTRRRRRSSKVRTYKSTATSLNNKVKYDLNISGFAAIQSDDLFAEYQSIKESLLCQRLPKDLKFNGSMKGIKAQNKDVAWVLNSASKFVETSLKIASGIQASRDLPGYNPFPDINDLLVCLIAHMRNIQDEHCLLSVGGNYGPRTQQIFKTIHTNPAQFTPTVSEELCCSATLAALPVEQNPQQNQNYRRNSGFQHQSG